MPKPGRERAKWRNRRQKELRWASDRLLAVVNCGYFLALGVGGIGFGQSFSIRGSRKRAGIERFRVHLLNQLEGAFVDLLDGQRVPRRDRGSGGRINPCRRTWLRKWRSNRRSSR